MNTRLKEFGGLAALRGMPTDDELAVLSHELYAGEPVDANAVHVRRMLLCHDQYDRTFERFPREMLKRFAETLPGKSMLPCHDTGGWLGGGSLPLARFFMAGLQRRNEDQFPVLRRARPRRGGRAAGQQSGPDAAPPGFDLEPTSVTYLRASFYFPNHETTEGLRANLDLGVYKWVSVGFRYDGLTCDICGNSYFDYGACPHLLGRMDDDSGQVCTATYSGNMEFCEALEGSLVYLGGQPRARIVKAMVDSGQVDPEKLATTPYGTDLVLLKEAEDLARHYGHAKRIYALGELPEQPGDDPAPVGLSLADEAAHVLACVGGFVDRAFDARDQRVAKGKRLGQQTLAGIRSIRSALDDLLQLDHDPEPVTPTDDALRAVAAAMVTDARVRAAQLGLDAASA